ncbi:hypothetical protein [Vulcanisaeta sp. JCM 14467]|uniref:hypothetical protein n=1 Tax=Vulcanisaeta sp. JCM 14467 TaxID=1295370 RepID=UPI002092F134|nr:hypothetical protein [Vulcanisaeta sp. JCM 14467]
MIIDATLNSIFNCPRYAVKFEVALGIIGDAIINVIMSITRLGIETMVKLGSLLTQCPWRS